MKKIVLNTFALATLFFASAANAQVGVGVPAGDIHPSAELEVKSSTKGFLPPRMTKAQRLAMIAQGSTTFPAAGLLVFQTDGDANEPTGLYFFDGTAWRNGAGVQGIKGDNGVKGDVGPKGDTGAQGVQGTQGQNTLAKTTTEAAGANCITGGVKIEYGFDANNSGTLDDAEINPALTKYVCNGIQGPIGEKGLKGDVGPKGDQGGVTSKIYTIGHWPELGGYVFRISADGRHGLVAETQDQSASSTCYLAQDVISNPLNHSTNGQKFMDWRLPTKYELNEMYLQKGAIGGFASNYYWSSTEYVNIITPTADPSGWCQHFNFGNQIYYFKDYALNVRAIRTF